MKKLKKETFFSGEGRYPERRFAYYCNTSNDPFRHELGSKKRPPERGRPGFDDFVFEQCQRPAQNPNC